MTTQRTNADWHGTAAIDMRGIAFKLGDRFARAYSSGRTCNLQICTVTRLENGNVYANGSKVNIKFPGRCLIVNEQFPPQEE